jgi:hypothetical protein
MKLLRPLMIVGGLVVAFPALAVYAPTPDQEQGKDLTLSLKAGFTYDTNIFGAATGAIDSGIWELAPKVSYNHSLTEQTFMAASYGLTADYFERRPGDKLLDSHEVNLRLAHQFSKSTTIDVNDVFQISRNPESLLPGIAGAAATPLTADQSFSRNQLDARFDRELTPKIGLSVKARSIWFKYDNATLGRSLDRIENLYGLAGSYAVLPEVKAVAEYRHQDVFYRKLGETKNKASDFAMGGFDYAAAKKMTVTGRFGYEWRARESERSTTTPYLEASLKYDYAEASYLAAGYTFTLEESSDTSRFTDTKVHRVFVSAQHKVTALITASATLIYENGTLQGRRSIPPFGFSQSNVDEDTVRAGLALSYLPTKNWMISVSYDYDNVDSGEASRNLNRDRVSVSGTYSF